MLSSNTIYIFLSKLAFQVSTFVPCHQIASLILYCFSISTQHQILLVSYNLAVLFPSIDSKDRLQGLQCANRVTYPLINEVFTLAMRVKVSNTDLKVSSSSRQTSRVTVNQTSRQHKLRTRHKISIS
ncbi:hypothetical protein P8452_36459 [Trifolium repens]|nr:hypothetical protein P8452_36459 [Trifolium repens]